MKNKQDHLTFLLANPEFVRWVKTPDKELDIYWSNWVQGHPEAAADILKAKALVMAFREKKVLPSPEQKARQLHEIITAEGKTKTTATSNGVSRKRKADHSSSLWDRAGQWNKVAAILMTVLICSGIYHVYTHVPDKAVLADIPPVPWVTKETLHGEKLMVKLSDGSSIWLNSGTVLRFPETFDSLSRELELTGEAYFEIASDQNRPMQILAGKLVTLVLGTSFTINTTDEKRQRISLISGKVQVKNSNYDQDIFLGPGEQLEYDPTTHFYKINPFKTENVLGWKDGILQLRNASMEDAVRALEKWYGVDIQVSGSPSRAWNLSSDFKNQDLDLVLERIAYIEAFDFTIDNKKVYIQF
ncbi:MAG TPA: FecR domain-containing protein [Lunatimonas sp.]|nr:FecR domain-containing protein [Lunatimonas sp.]